MMNRNTQSKREKIYRSSPELKKIIDECGNQSLTEYVSRHVQYICPVSEDRQREFASAISLLIDFKASSNGVVSDVHTQLKKNWSVSTADHQGPATHPFFVSAQFLRQRALASSSNLLALTLPCAGISMSNSSFPRGIQFHDEFMREHRLSFVGWRDRNISVYAAKQYDKSDYEKVLETLHSLKLSNTLEQQVQSLLASVFEPSVSFSGTYDAQMSVVNNRLGTITNEGLAFK